MLIKKMLCFSLASLVLGFGLFCSTANAAEDYVKLIGAGASFPAPLYSKWFKDYHGLHPNVQVDYQSVGSGSGIKNFINKTVDFGASDAGMNAEERAQVDVGVQLLPMTAGAIVLSYNLEGVQELKLTREAYSGIFLGKVTKWNDPLIAKSNPGVKLPDIPINVVVRADSSGTTFVFSQHLAAISPEFAQKSRRQHDAELDRRHPVQGQRRHYGEHPHHTRIDRLYRIRLCQRTAPAHGRSGEQGR